MSKKKKTKKGSGAGVDLIDKQKSKDRVVPPSKYQVIYYNDDFTPMNWVVVSLIAFFKHTEDSAWKITMSVHERGKGIAGGPYSKEIADTKAEKVVQFFRASGYPLMAKSEKVQ